jgi:hypothetical protein
MPPEPQEPKFCIRPMQSSSFVDRLGDVGTGAESGVAGCPVCGGKLIEIRAKFQCSRCHRICETCCEGGRG